MRNNRKIFLISGIFLVVLIIVFISLMLLRGGNSGWFSGQENRDQVNNKDKKEEIQKDQEKDSNDFNVVKRHKPLNKESCQDKSGEKKEECLQQLQKTKVIKKGNIKKCLDLDDLKDRDNCIKNLIIRYNYSIDLCWSISDVEVRSSCINSMILRSGDKNLCEKYHNRKTPLETCKDRIDAFDISSDPDREIKDCENLSALEYPHLCKMKSIENKYGSNCDEVPPEYKDYCIAIKKGKSAESKEECKKIELEEYKQFCLLKVEKRKNNPGETIVIDNDNDGFNDSDELFYGTSINNPDTDGDGVNDRQEIADGTNPLDPEDNGKKTPKKTDQDSDGDGLPNDLEKRIGTDPQDPDTDGDGMTDREEWAQGFDPFKKGQDLYDTDGDGLIDINEAFYGTDKFKKDTDGDGATDKEEVKNLTNPTGEGDMDFDDDGLTDKREKRLGTNPTLKDTDEDGLTDYEEVEEYGTDPLKEDTDGDGLTDKEEIDKYNSDPLDPDTDGDGYNDGEEVESGFDPTGGGKLED